MVRVRLDAPGGSEPLVVVDTSGAQFIDDGGVRWIRSTSDVMTFSVDLPNSPMVDFGFDYTLEVIDECEDRFEPNHRREDAVHVAVGRDHLARSCGEDDWFRVWLEPGAGLQVTTRPPHGLSVDSDWSATIELYGPDGQQHSGGQHTASVQGWHDILVSPLSTD